MFSGVEPWKAYLITFHSRFQIYVDINYKINLHKTYLHDIVAHFSNEMVIKYGYQQWDKSPTVIITVSYVLNWMKIIHKDENLNINIGEINNNKGENIVPKRFGQLKRSE